MIHVLMICNVFPEEIGPLFNRNKDYGGGWIVGNIQGMKRYNDIQLSYAVFKAGTTDLIQEHVQDDVTYSLITYQTDAILQEFFQTHSFDLCHLYGAEHAYIPDITPFLPFEKTIVYIQGLQSEYYWHYNANCDQYHSVSPLFHKYIDMNKKILKKQVDGELEVFKKARFITGRTDWDRAFLFKNHCTGTYYNLNETLRPDFYTAEKWSIEKMQPHTVFVTQAGYPIKAAHMIAEILHILKSHYPDVKSYIGGGNLTTADSAATKLGVSYASLIQKLIKEYGLENHMIFTGSLSSTQVIEKMQTCNAFLLASSIENSPNSLQEAMLLGVPCVSSYVGGVSSIADHTQAMLYPFDDPMAAAYALHRIFEDKELCKTLSQNAMKQASKLTDPATNAKRLHDIYLCVFDSIQ